MEKAIFNAAIWSHAAFGVALLHDAPKQYF